MGLCLSQEEREARERSSAIDRLIEVDNRRINKECKILLLGSGESGKSTIVKQMKIIHQNGYTTEELSLFRVTIFKNLVDSAQCLIFAMKKLDMEPFEPKNKIHAKTIISVRYEGAYALRLTPDLVEAIDSLWKDPVIANLMDRQSEFYLMDSAMYFFNHARRIGAPNYIPNEADVLRARTKTTGIIETRFNMGQLSIHMFDVGGQRSERKKWIHCFEAVTSIIFCVALSEYDQVLLEESEQNRMTESLILFESVVNSRWFLRTSIIFFLNKIDLFREKLPRIPLEKYFPEYTGGSDITKAAKYILWRFTQTNRAKLNIYPHLTQATDTSKVCHGFSTPTLIAPFLNISFIFLTHTRILEMQIRLVFAAVKETILQNALRDSGIL